MKKMTVVMMAMAAVALSACDGGEQGGMELAEADRYCELTQQLDRAGEQEIEIDFEAATPDPEAVQAEFSDFLADNSDDIEELERIAPPEISDDVAALTESMRTVAETGELGAFDASAEAEERIREFENQVCDSEN